MSVLKNRMLVFTLVTLLIGFMLAVQFQTIKEPTQRDTRDIWELREEIIDEKELQSNLIREIRQIEEQLNQYEQNQQKDELEVLKNTLEELKIEAGLTKYKGPGLTITISPFFQGIELGQDAVDLTPELLKKLVNELNMYGAEHLSIQGQRITNTSVIRDVNFITKVDGVSVDDFPVEIKVVAENKELAEKIYNRIQASHIADEFFMEDLELTVSEVSDEIKLSAYLDPIRIRFMKPVEE